jgi:hypothetical protein
MIDDLATRLRATVDPDRISTHSPDEDRTAFNDEEVDR